MATAQQVVTIRQVVSAAGVSTTTLDNWRRGTPTKTALPTIKHGHFVYVPVAGLKAWAKAHSVKLDVKQLVPTKLPEAKPATTAAAKAPAKKSTTAGRKKAY